MSPTHRPLKATVVTLVLLAGAILWPSRAQASVNFFNLVNGHSNGCLSEGGGNDSASQLKCTGFATNPDFARIQLFAPRRVGAGFQQLISVEDGRCLQVDGASLDDNHIVNFANCGDNALNQQWQLRPGGLIVARHSNKCLSVLSESLIEGAKIVQFTCDGGVAENWRFA